MKYKITYKGLDNKQETLQIMNYMEENGWKYASAPGSNPNILKFKKEDNTFRHTEYHFIISLAEKDILKYLAHPHLQHVKFTKEELKFFDFMDFEIHPNAVAITGQNITDWIHM